MLIKCLIFVFFGVGASRKATSRKEQKLEHPLQYSILKTKYVANSISGTSAKLGTFDIKTFSVTRYPSSGKICVPLMMMTGCACSTSQATADISQCSCKELNFKSIIKVIYSSQQK